MTDLSIDDLAEQLVREAAELLTAPRSRECLLCYVARMLEEFRCDCTLRFALAYRDRRAPRATALTRRLAGAGGLCDCEIFLHGWAPAPSVAQVPQRVDLRQQPRDRRRPEPLDALSPCRGAGPHSTRPCGLWVRRGRADR